MDAKGAAKADFWERAVEWGLSVLDDVDVPRHKRPERADATVARVRQVDETSCGVAVAAMFARQTHATVKAFMFPQKAKRVFYTHFKDVWQALDEFGVRHEKKVHKFQGWTKIPSNALVKIRWKGVPERLAYHWVIYQPPTNGKYRVIDPASEGDTLVDIELSACVGVEYSLATPRTLAEGPLKKASRTPTAPQPAARPVPAIPMPTSSTPLLALGSEPVMSLRSDTALALAVSMATKLSPGAVRNRALKVDGKTRVRKVFADRWPSRLDELGAEPSGALLADAGHMRELAKLLGSSESELGAALRKRASMPASETLDDHWPAADSLTSTAILRMSVQQARAAGKPDALARALNIDLARFARRIRSAHGAALMKNAFADLLTGQTSNSKPKGLDRFEVTPRTWKGGFAVVQEAWDRTTNPHLHVVLKRPHAKPTAIKALETEYERARDLRHPGLAGYFALEREADGKPVLVIEYGGISLREHLEKGPMSLQKSIELCDRVADALDYLVKRGSVGHFDIHPGNILIDEKGRPRITDFGIAKVLGGKVGETVITSPTVGFSEAFGAPEVRHGGGSRSSDQYSLALVFLTCVAGFDGAKRTLRTNDLPRDLGAAQAAAFWKARSEQAKQRFESCRAFMAAIRGDEV